MNQLFIFKPKSHKTIWIFKSTINNKTRINVCLRKLDRLYHNNTSGFSKDAIAAGYFHNDILATLYFFKKESDRMKSLILKKTKSAIKFEGDTGLYFELIINSPLSALFYELLQLLDDLMCLAKTCFDLGIFEYRSLPYRKIESYKRKVKLIVHNVCQYKIIFVRNSLNNKK